MLPLNLYARVRSSIHIAHETAGAARTRSSLRPLFGEGGRTTANPGRLAPRDREGVFGRRGCLTFELRTHALFRRPRDPSTPRLRRGHDGGAPKLWRRRHAGTHNREWFWFDALGRQACLNNKRRWLWVPAQGRDDGGESLRDGHAYAGRDSPIHILFIVILRKRFNLSIHDRRADQKARLCRCARFAQRCASRERRPCLARIRET